MTSIRIQNQLEAPWTNVAPIRLGDVPPEEATPKRYVVVEESGALPVRIDVYGRRGREEAFAFEDAIIWRDWLVIGLGEWVHLVNPRAGLKSSLDLGGYFGHFYPLDSCLLVASCDRLFRLEPDGRFAWSSGRLGIDGVVVDRVSRDTIQGEGEWDPPGGWRPFFVDLQFGKPVGHSDQFE